MEKLNYVFEKVSGEQKWQVRLKGEFVCYVDKKDSSIADERIRKYGFDSRRDFLDYTIMMAINSL